LGIQYLLDLALRQFFVSLRLRLTLLYTTILTLTLSVFAFAIHLTVARVMRDAAEDALWSEALRIVNDRRFELKTIAVPVDTVGAPFTYVQTRDLDGQLMGKTFSYGDWTLPLNAQVFAQALSGQSTFEVISQQDKRLLLLTSPVLVRGQLVGVIQVARSMADQDQALASLQTVLLVGTGMALVFAFGIGWLMAGATLQPIREITASAHAIGTSRDFSRRVAYSGPPDELGQLADTLNAMLVELQAVYQSSEQSLQTQRRFVADASHELRTPLTTIRGNLGLLELERLSPEDRRATLADAISETERMMRLVNNLLTLARSDAGGTLTHEAVSLPSTVAAVMRQARLLAPDRKLTQEEVPDVKVEANRDALQQVLLILLDNAFRHTPGDARVHLAAEIAGEEARIRVSDTGPGIPRERLPQIFQRFFRGDRSRTGGGAGLGLSIAKTLIEAQKGRLTAESTPGVGTTFTLALPLA
jgi:signal transduction histidine kinase